MGLGVGGESKEIIDDSLHPLHDFQDILAKDLHLLVLWTVFIHPDAALRLNHTGYGLTITLLFGWNLIYAKNPRKMLSQKE